MYNSVTIFKGATLLDISLIMLGAGNSSRFELPVKKQWLRIGSDPLWLFATKNLSNFYTFKEIIVVSKECKYMSKFAPNYKFVDGGKTRQDSLKNALELVSSEFVLVSDIARPCISSELFHKIIEAAAQADCVVPALKIADTAYLGENAIDREKVKLIQTPQLSRTALLKKALSSGEIYTDDSSAMRAIGASVWHILGDEMARKITFKEDLSKISALTSLISCFSTSKQTARYGAFGSISFIWVLLSFCDLASAIKISFLPKFIRLEISSSLSSFSFISFKISFSS